MTTPVPMTLFQKIWQQHKVCSLSDTTDLLHVDRHLMHDLGGKFALEWLEAQGKGVACPELTFATADHTLPSAIGENSEKAQKFVSALELFSTRHEVTYFPRGSGRQGIVHVLAPELGVTLPGMTVVCTDSHTCTQGALGTLAFGIGASEMMHVLASQTLVQKKVKQFRISYHGSLANGVTAKDLILYTIAKFGVDAGVGYAVEFSGPLIREMTIEERMTICNLAVELGAKFGIVAPDQKTIEYVADKPLGPDGPSLKLAVADWQNLESDEDAFFERDEVINASDISPQISWGTSPEQTIAIDDMVRPARQDADGEHQTALEYMALSDNQGLFGVPVDVVFIGSCANSRLSDLRQAASILGDRKVAPGVKAWVVPGSEAVAMAAEAEGLAAKFIDAGFEWRQSGCSLCCASNGDTVMPGQRCVSTSNRNFVGRQGPGARTHLASPLTAVASALAGTICDPRSLL